MIGFATGRPPVIRIKRVYASAHAADGRRFLVDRLWPRGVRKAQLRLDDWIPEVAPSHTLRRWFGHDPAKWPEFVRSYYKELDAHPRAWKPLLTQLRRGPITLLFSARDPEHNNAVALRSYLLARQRRASHPRR